jgi:hypothetical protein
MTGAAIIDLIVTAIQEGIVAIEDLAAALAAAGHTSPLLPQVTADMAPDEAKLTVK